MFDAKTLWKARVASFLKEISRYLKYMFNDHLMIVLVILLGGGALVYKDWVSQLPPDFPGLPLIALVAAVLLTHSPVFTLLKQPDLVFLLPLETKLKPYFQRALLFSWVLQIYLLFLLLAALGPIYVQVTGKPFSVYSGYLLILFLVKGWNILANWYRLYLTDKRIGIVEALVRAVINFGFVYMLLDNGPIWYLAAFILVMAAILLGYDTKLRGTRSLKWETLIEGDAHRMTTFYRLANLFTDVPELKSKVKRRSWLNWLTATLPFKPISVHRYLYWKTFARTSDYLGIYVRLIVIGGIVLYFVDSRYIKAGTFVLFLYLTGYQLMTLYRHHRNNILLDLYPVPSAGKIKAFMFVLFQLLMVQSLLYTMAVLLSGDWVAAILLLAAGVIFSLLFTNLYAVSRLKKFN